jgi:putative acetyltransferase
LEISNHTEQFIIEALRAAKALTVSLVAEVDGRVTGYIAFSPLTISDGTRDWYGLGPVSVLPSYQRQGIGKSLVREGLSRLRNMNAIVFVNLATMAPNGEKCYTRQGGSPNGRGNT